MSARNAKDKGLRPPQFTMVYGLSKAYGPTQKKDVICMQTNDIVVMETREGDVFEGRLCRILDGIVQIEVGPRNWVTKDLKEVVALCLKEQVEERKPAKVVIVLEAGLIEDVYSTEPIDYVKLDASYDGDEEAYEVEGIGTKDMYLVDAYSGQVNPELVEKIHKQCADFEDAERE